MLGHDGLDRVLVRRPVELVDVDDATWDRVAEAADRPAERARALAAWNNGTAFLHARDGLRGRRPLRVEWKGGQRAPGPAPVPVDLRVDHVFLVSCKYASRILLNAAPARLFGADGEVPDWYLEVAAEPLQQLFALVRRELADLDLPPFVGDLAAHHRRLLKEHGGRITWSGPVTDAYADLARQVGRVSAERWRRRLRTARQREEVLWRLLRITDAPYFVLGTQGDRVLRVRVATPWDWRRRYELRSLETWGAEAGQPRVDWRATVRDRDADDERVVEGHVEIRWSHGRFAQPPEAKVYLDTPHHRVPGYEPLD